ncbi:unnamed protein product, partial [Symbiodinium microadriaticum]
QIFPVVTAGASSGLIMENVLGLAEGSKGINSDTGEHFTEAWAWAADTMDRMCCNTVRNLDDFLLPETPPLGCGMDLSQGFRGAKQVRHNRCEIVTPHGQLFLASRARFATGLECMWLQQLHFGQDQFKVESDFDEHQPLLQDLAGNAMNSFCLSAVLTVKRLLEARLRTAALLRQRQQQH